jgi:CBS domain-containing protein
MELLNMLKGPLITAPLETTVSDAVALMVENKVGAVVVVDRFNRVAGIFTESDNLNRVTYLRKDPARTLISEVMTHPVDTVSGDMEIESVISQMIQRRYRHLPVVDMDGRIKGIVSLRYLLLRMLSKKEANLQMLEAYVTAGGPG